jgi:porin
MGQVTSVDQLADVQPTDWAYQALRSLIERYGVSVGYPNGLFRGNRAVSRYEFAAGLNALLDRITSSITQRLTTQVSGADLVTLQKLQAEFGEELAALRTRVDDIEARSAELEANQFSTTTRLTGQAIIAFNDGIQGGAEDPGTILFSRLRLNLESSFTGADALLAQIEVGSSGPNGDAASFLQREDGSFREALSDAGDRLTDQALRQTGSTLDQTPDLRLNNQDSLDNLTNRLATNLQSIALSQGRSPTEAQRVFDTTVETVNTARGINGFLQTNSALDYSGRDGTSFLNRLSYSFSPFPDANVSLFARGYASDYVDFNRFANNSGLNFSTYGLINNQLLLANDPPGAGAAFRWTPNRGFFTLRAVYRAEQAAIATRPANVGNQSGLFGDPYLGIIELGLAPFKNFNINLQYSRGAQGDNEYEVFGTNVAWKVNRQIGLFGRFGYATNFPGGIQPSAWSMGVTVSDLLIPGTVLGVGVGQPLIFQESILGLFNRTQTNYELFYNLPLSDGISVSPALQLITDPGNQSRNAIFTATLRTVFSF